MTTQVTPIHFTKMHGLGNDFVVINAIDQSIDIKKLAIAKLADRHLGIGFDQLLLIEPAMQADFFCRIFNADGSEAEQCGNGLRCVARFIHEQGLIKNTAFQLETTAGIFPVNIADYAHISIALGSPNIEENLIELSLQQPLTPIKTSILSLGNPHAIVKVTSVETVNVNDLGPAIAAHHYFPHSANVGFMQIINPQHIRLRTYERGIGETHACGSNACAAVAAGIANGWLQQQVTVEVRYGSLSIDWPGIGKAIQMIGPATQVFSGKIYLR